MARLTLPALEQFIGNYVTAAKLSNTTFVETRNNVAGLLDKIGKITTIENPFLDKLWMLDGEYLSDGKTVEEFYQNLIMPQDYDETGANTLAPVTLDYVKPAYSYTLGKRVVKSTIRNNDIERAVHNAGQFARILNQQMSRLYDSEVTYRYTLKKEILAKYYELINECYTNADQWLVGPTYPKGSYIKDGEKVAVVVKTFNSNDIGSWNASKSRGYIVELDLIRDIAKPSDATTGEDFILQVKKDVETASFTSEGNSLNGNTLGSSEEGLLLIVKKGIMPEIDVKVLAGAFHQDKVAMPVEIVTVDNFGTADENVYAMMIDRRGVKLHNTYRAVREQFNADGDFINYVLHLENTGYISRNTFVKVYRENI